VRVCVRVCVRLCVGVCVCVCARARVGNREGQIEKESVRHHVVQTPQTKLVQRTGIVSSFSLCERRDGGSFLPDAECLFGCLTVGCLVGVGRYLYVWLLVLWLCGVFIFWLCLVV